MADQFIGIGVETVGIIAANYIRANLVDGSSSLSSFGVTGTQYCGPGYSGGQFGGDNFSIPFTKGSAVDEKCQSHDIKYAEANGKPDAGYQRTQADLTLLTEMLVILANPHLHSARDLGKH